MLFLLPFDLIARRGMAASAVGLTLIPFGLIIGLLSRRSGGLADRYGARNLLVGGSLMVALGAAWIALSLENFWIGVFVPLLVMALGMAAVVTPLTTVVMNSAPDAQAGAASGINNAASRVAGLVAVAVLGTIAGLLFRWAGATPRSRFGELPAADDASRATLEQAFVVAYSSAMAIAAIWCVLAAATAFFWLTAGGLHGISGEGRDERSLRAAAQWLTRRRTPTSRARSCADRRSPARPHRDRDATPASAARRR